MSREFDYDAQDHDKRGQREEGKHGHHDVFWQLSLGYTALPRADFLRNELLLDGAIRLDASSQEVLVGIIGTGAGGVQRIGT